MDCWDITRRWNGQGGESGLAACDYVEKNCLSLTVIKWRNNLSSDINTVAVEEKVSNSEIGVPIIDAVDDYMVFPSQECS